MHASPPPVTQTPPGRPKPSRVNWRLFADVVAFATAVISLVVAIFAGASRNQAQDEAASLNDRIASLDAEISSLSQERDRLQEELDASPTPEETTTSEGTEEGPVVAGETEGEYTSLDQAVAQTECEGNEDWVPSTLSFSGEQHFEGFQCDIIRGQDDAPPSAYVDFVVPSGATRLTGLAGIDDTSIDDTMVVKFSILSVPDNGESLFTETLAFGDGGAPFDVALGDVTRVRFLIEIASSDHWEYTWTATVGWADVRFE